MSTALITIDEWLRTGQRVSIPVSAFTLDGFRKWCYSDEFPDYLKISFISGTVYIEHLLDDASVDIPPTAATLDGFLEWADSDDFPRHGHVSYVGSRILIDMSPEEIETHNKVKGAISNKVSTLVYREDKGEFYFDRTLVANRGARLSTEPDGTFVLWESLETERVRPISRRHRQGEYIRLEGSPDWILEVISRSSFEKDTKTLPPKYHRAKVSELWLVDATEEEIDFRILVWQTDGYVPGPVKDGWHYSPLFQRYFRLTRHRTRFDTWRYELRTRKGDA